MDMDQMLEKALAIKSGKVGEIDSLIRLIRSAELESYGMCEDQIDQALNTLFPESNRSTDVGTSEPIRSSKGSTITYIPGDTCLESFIFRTSRPLRAIEALIFKGIEVAGRDSDDHWSLLSQVGDAIADFLDGLEHALQNAKVNGEPVLVGAKIEHPFGLKPNAKAERAYATGN